MKIEIQSILLNPMPKVPRTPLEHPQGKDAVGVIGLKNPLRGDFPDLCKALPLGFENIYGFIK